MKLLLDAGNTRLKWGLLDDAGAWCEQGVLDYPQLDALPQCWASRGRPDEAWAVNVAGDAIGMKLQAQLAAHQIALRFVRAAPAACGVTNLYRDPAQLGADRFVALIAARACHAGPALVVCAGTATTVDVLDADGRFQGGLIVPGLDLMRRSLNEATADLPLAQAAPTALPRSTDEAIIAGCLAAQLGAVRAMWQHLAPHPDALCLMSGGAAETLLPHLELPARWVPNLVLDGLAVVAQQGDDRAG